MFSNIWHKLGALVASAGVLLPVLGYIPGKIPALIVGAVGVVTALYTDVDKVLNRTTSP